MELSGTHTFKAPQRVVWDVLTDPQTLHRTLPGCQQFELQPDGSYHLTINIGIASVKGVYTGVVHLLNEQPPDSYTLKVSARGGVGHIDGTGNFRLGPQSGGNGETLLTYTGDAHVGGKIAGVGQRLLHAGANLVIGQFFRAVEKEAASRDEGRKTKDERQDIA